MTPFSYTEDTLVQQTTAEHLERELGWEEKRPELPETALREAVVNALTHRNYRSTANVQVYIFKDRIEIVRPGTLPAGMTEADLGTRSVPRNPLLFGMLHRMEAVEHIGSGIRRIRSLCREDGVAEPEFEVSEHWVTTTFRRRTAQVGTKSGLSRDQATGEVAGDVADDVAGEVIRVVLAFKSKPVTRAELQKTLRLKGQANFRDRYLQPALKGGWVDMMDVIDRIHSKNTSSCRQVAAIRLGNR